MRERLTKIRGVSGLPGHPLLLLVGAVVGFVVVVASQLHPADPESRLPDQYRLSALIARQQAQNEQQRADVESLRQQISDARNATQSQKAGVAAQSDKLSKAGLTAGTVPMTGTGLTVTLADSSLEEAPTGNVNDLVIHSQDVQGVVNAMWAAGAEAISVNGQRLVSTSAVLCVGNTLLLNGTVHAPPYEVRAIGANRDQFLDDQLVKALKADAERFSLRFSVSHDERVEVPGYSGPTVPKYAQITS